ncbi:aromatic ring-hydroxylating oxygenase subunit alpha [Benzoatithermus flavus]|uniref:Aromatic ring-hydroxylating dioxygenase subunit alpha n=1 Tax=Benzoatithermus flavus TaxID=3108223 RepID=A0ABU8XW23_9PROT
MLDVSLPDIRDLVRRRRPGYSLEAPFYTSQAVFDLDLEAIFDRHWIFVGVEPDVPEPGDYVTVGIGRQSIVIVRDDDNEVRAFHNLCRHRGARLLHEERGSVGNIVCRYHHWAYDLTGALLHAEHMGESFDRSCHGLVPVHLRNLEGLLFVCLADEPPADFDAMAATMAPFIAPHDLRHCKVAHRMDLIEEGNWKLTMENNRECYHCSNHPELGLSFFPPSFGFDPADISPEQAAEIAAYEAAKESFRARWAACGLPVGPIEDLVTRPTGFRTERLVLSGAGESQTMSTKIACRKLLGSFTEPKLGGLHFWTQPNSWHHFMSDHTVHFSAIPLSPERTLVRTWWLVHRDAVEGVDYDLERLTEVWIATNAQDGELVGYTQAGVRSKAYRPGPYSPFTESLVDAFTTWYVRRLSAHLGIADEPGCRAA